MSLAGCDSLFGTDEQEYMSRGVDHYQGGQYRESIIEFRNALQENPENAQARFYLGIARIEIGDFASARRDLERARELGYSDSALLLPLAQSRFVVGDNAAVLDVERPEDMTQANAAELYALRGRAALRMDDVSRAREEFRQALAADPGSANARFGQVLLARVDNNAERMREWVNRTLSANENHVEAWQTRALLDLAQGRNDDAEAALSNAIEASASPSPSDLYRRTMLRLQRDAVDEAREDAEQLIRVASDFAGGRYALGLVELYEGDAGTAQTEMEAALSRDDQFSPARLMLGVIHGDAGRFDQARYQLERYRALEPEESVGSLMLAALEAREGNVESAKQKLDEHVARFPADRHAQSLRTSLADGEDTEGAMTRVAFSMMGRGETASDAAGAQLRDEAIAADERDGGEGPSEDDLNAIRTALANEEFDQALESVESLIESHPESGELHRLKAGAHMGRGEANAAFQSLARAVELDPGNLDAIRNLGQLLVRAGQEDAALALFRRAREDHPDHLGLALGLAQMEQRAGNEERLDRLLVDSIERHPEALEPRLIYARRLLSLGESNEALEVIEPLAETHASHPTRLLVEAQAFESLGELTQARQAWETLVEQQPDNDQFRFALATNQARLEDYAAARETLRHAVEREPESMQPRILIMRTYAMEGDHDAAETEYQRLVEDFEVSRGLLSQGATLALERGDVDAGINRLQQAHAMEPTEQGAMDLARAHSRADQHDDALAVMEEWKEQADGELSERAWHALAGARLSAGAEEGAIAVYEDLLEANPDNPVTLNNLAWALRENNPRRAVTLAERALEHGPESADIQHTLAVALRHAGDPQRGIDLMEEVVERDERPEFRLELAELYMDADRSGDARTILRELAEMDDFDGVLRARELLDELSDV